MSYDDYVNPAQFRQLYHGTNQVFKPGDSITPGRPSNYPGNDLADDEAGKMVYGTPSRTQAFKFALQAVQHQGIGSPNVYRVKPTGNVNWDTETSPEDFGSDAEMQRQGARMSHRPFTVEKKVRIPKRAKREMGL